MTYELPYPLPRNYNPSGPYRNPGQTLPLPVPDNHPVGCWFGSLQRINWAVSGSSRLVSDAGWQSPIFDLRPDLRGLIQNTSNKTPSAVPIWSNAGTNVGVHLWIQIDGAGATGLNSIDLRGFQILAKERAHICDVAQIRSINNLQDVTAQFSSQGESAILAWTPFGDGYPVRYYQLKITLRIRENFSSGGNPDMTIRGAMY